MTRRRLGQWLQQTVFVGPALLVFIVIIVIPLVMSVYYSFTEWNGISTAVKWVGLDNYKQILFHDTLFRDDFYFTFRLALVQVVLTNAVGLLLALMLTQPLKTKNIQRTIFFMPNVIGGLLLGFIWQFIFIKGFASIGEITHIGFFQLPWLGDAATGFWGIIIVSVWQGAGYLMIIYIAGFANVPSDLLEAARIDGASRWQLFRSIKLPLIMPSVTVCFFLSISWAFKIFDIVLSLTKGGPYNSTESIALNIYQEAFRNNRYGLGTAKALIFFVIVALITVIQVAYTKKKEVEV
ncbi:sugar ABC transporter permease [Paenibacillus psychroresistens]|uniref:Sugar ABC transporter permease n=1 Tax=Paenibacillus psychroresistens TaxID=1778678 RepID=A0A6B8RNG3_9BACL|nr:sugar ABC transporter permease [Paenibacillus psychroresistens]QGQ97095.1 sugar ABC transporter permease [Paenibacillus psychroresistens]